MIEMMSGVKNKKWKKTAVANTVETYSGIDVPDCNSAIKPENFKSMPCELHDTRLTLKSVDQANLEKLLSEALEEKKRLENLNGQLQQRLKIMESLESKDVTIQQIYVGVMKQQEELLELTRICNRQKSKLKTMKEAIESARCPDCALRSQSRSAATASENKSLPFGVQCASDSDPDQHSEREVVVLLNDGRTYPLLSPKSDIRNAWSRYEDLRKEPMPLTSKSYSLRAASASSSTMLSLYNSDDANMQQSIRSNTTLVPSLHREDFALRVEPSKTPDGSVKRTIIHICPMCGQDGFSTPEELSVHVNSHFPDDDMLG